MTGKEEIEAERKRQQEEEGFDASHDAQHGIKELMRAAESYEGAKGPRSKRPGIWPWSAARWKPKSRRRNLVRAGALYLAAADLRDARKGRPAGNDSIQAAVDRCAAALDQLEG